MSSGKWRPSCLGLNVLTHCGLVMPYAALHLGQHWFSQWHVACLQSSTYLKIFACLTSKLLHFKMQILNHFQHNLVKIHLSDWQFYLPGAIVQCDMCLSSSPSHYLSECGVIAVKFLSNYKNNCIKMHLNMFCKMSVIVSDIKLTSTDWFLNIDSTNHQSLLIAHVQCKSWLCRD